MHQGLTTGKLTALNLREEEIARIKAEAAAATEREKGNS